MSEPSFNFELPQRHKGISEHAQTALDLSLLAETLALENRTLVNHITGRPENVAEHSNLLGIVAPAYAEQFYPHLDANLIARYAPIYDIVEAYVHDTPTHIFSTELLATKDALEKFGFAKLKTDFAGLPGFVNIVCQYEEQVVPEARYLRVFDKLAPLLMHFAEGGVTYRRSFSEGFALQNASKREIYLRENYPDFSDLIDVRQELSSLALREFLA